MGNESMSLNKSDRGIPLVKALANADHPQATPLTVFKLARLRWLNGKRISIGDLAKEVGVSRVTLYRWVGSKDRLVEEILWSFAKPSFEKAIKETPGIGVEHIVAVHRRFMTELTSFEPMRRFIHQNPNVAVRIQTRDPMSAHGRLIELTGSHIAAQAEAGPCDLPGAPYELAEMMVYTNGSLLYGAIIGERSKAAAIELACSLSRLLLTTKIS
jgi:AcrR family transcriptional regulator